MEEEKTANSGTPKQGHKFNTRKRKSEDTDKDFKVGVDTLLQANSGDPAHLDRWAKTMELIANKLYPKLGSMYVTNKLPDLPKIEIPDAPYNNDTDPYGIQRQMIIEATKLRVQAKSKMEAACSSLFAEMMVKLSDKSLQGIKTSVYEISIRRGEELHKQHVQDYESYIKERNRRKSLREKKSKQQTSISSSDVQSTSSSKTTTKKSSKTKQAEDHHDDDDDEAQQKEEVPINDDDIYISEPHDEYIPEDSEDIWNEFRANADPLELWNAIQDSHRYRKTGSQTQDRLKAIKFFWALSMRENQTLDRYYEIWNSAVKSVELTGGTLPGGKEMAETFITSLDGTRWGRMQAEAYNAKQSHVESIRNNAYPSSVNAAYLLAARRAEAGPQAKEGGSRYPVALMTVAKEPTKTSTKYAMVGKGSKVEKSQDSKADDKIESEVAKETKSSKPCTRPCNICSDMHWTSDCPYMADCRALVRTKTAKSGNTAVGRLCLVTQASDTHATMPLPPDAIMIDNNSDVHVFNNPKLLTNIAEAKECFYLNGINKDGSPLLLNMEGDHLVGKVYYSPTAVGNILSQTILEDRYPCESKSGVSFCCQIGESILTFERYGNRYVHFPQHARVTTVCENETEDIIKETMKDEEIPHEEIIYEETSLDETNEEIPPEQFYEHIKGLIHNFTGTEFTYKNTGGVEIRMDGYVKEIIKEYGVKDLKQVKYPANQDMFKIDAEKEILPESEQHLFRSRVMKIMHLAIRTRPDLFNAISFLSTRMGKCTSEDMEKLHQVYCYINSTTDLFLTLQGDDPVHVRAWIDAAHGLHDDMRGHTGGNTSLGKRIVELKIDKAKCNTKLTCESELIGIADYMSVPIQIREFLEELGYNVEPATIYPDKQSTRHIAMMRHFFAKDRVDNGEVEFVYCPTADIVADILTKPLVGKAFFKHRKKLLNLP